VIRVSFDGTFMEFLPASFDTFISFQGADADNALEIRVINFTDKLSCTSSGFFTVRI